MGQKIVDDLTIAERARLRDWMRRQTSTAVAARVGAGRNALERAAAGLRSHAGTTLLVRVAFARLDGRREPAHGVALVTGVDPALATIDSTDSTVQS